MARLYIALAIIFTLFASLKEARHLKGARVLCDKRGASLTQKEVQVNALGLTLDEV